MPRRKKKKMFYPKRNAIYSIQFYRDENGTLNMLETSQGGSIDDWLSMGVFGLRLCESKLLCKEEKIALAKFCTSFLLCMGKGAT